MTDFVSAFDDHSYFQIYNYYIYCNYLFCNYLFCNYLFCNYLFYTFRFLLWILHSLFYCNGHRHLYVRNDPHPHPHPYPDHNHHSYRHRHHNNSHHNVRYYIFYSIFLCGICRPLLPVLLICHNSLHSSHHNFADVFLFSQAFLFLFLINVYLRNPHIPFCRNLLRHMLHHILLCLFRRCHFRIRHDGVLASPDRSLRI